MTTTLTRKTSKTTKTLARQAVETSIVALLDADMPAKVTGLTGLAEPDFFEGGLAYWIGADGTVACEIGMLPKLARVVEDGSFKARSGEFPAMHGVVVTPFDPEFAHVASKVLSKYADAHSQWRIAQDTVLVEG